MDKTDLFHRVRVGRPAAVTARSERILAIAVPTSGILLAEGFLFQGRIRLALFVHLLLVFGCLLAPVVVGHDATMYHIFVVIPLFRLLNFGMPIFFESALSRLWLIYAGLLVVVYDVAYVQPEIEFSDAGDVRETFNNAPTAVIVAGVLATAGYVALRPNALVESWTSPDFLIFVLVIVVSAALAEEFLFRGLLQETLIERVGAFPAIGISALVFGAMYSTHGTLVGLGFGVASGLVYGYVYHWKRNVLLVTVIHSASNLFLFGPFLQ